MKANKTISDSDICNKKERGEQRVVGEGLGSTTFAQVVRTSSFQ